MATPTLLVMTPDDQPQEVVSEPRDVSIEQLVENNSTRSINSRLSMGVRRRRVLKVTTHRSNPSSSSSIPSRYQTFYTPTTERKGFSSQATRFAPDASAGITVNECPGPGSYSVTENSIQQVTPSFSKRGTGGLASRSRRFVHHARVKCPGPGWYNPAVPDIHSDFSRAGVSCNFHKPLIPEQYKYHHCTPAPNYYTVSDDVTAKNTLITAQAAFKSGSKRQPCHVHTLSNPGPGQYDIKTDLLSSSNRQQSMFQSNTKREFPLSCFEGPGPADYRPLLSLPHHSRVNSNHNHKHYLCISAPAIPLPPCRPSPGPGHYETQQPSEVKSKLVSGAVFKSTTSRWGKHPTNNNQPGPGAYNLRDSVHKSFLCNINHKWTS